MRDTAIIPFTIKRTPIEKILLINFEKHPDTIYHAFELQYLNGEPYGKGYRVIAYRTDHYVDVYDDEPITYLSRESFSVALNGLGQHLTVSMKNVRFSLKEHRLEASFEFWDKLNRFISVHISENNVSPSKEMKLLAPIGLSSKEPEQFPLYFLYRFDFIQKKHTNIQITIDGKNYKPDSFPAPIPKDFKWRYFTRYSMDTQLFEFAPNGVFELRKVTLNEKLQAKLGHTTYSFTRYGQDNHLAAISYQERQYHFVTSFSPGLPDLMHLLENNTYTGNIQITSTPLLGKILGTYAVKLVGNYITFVMTFDQGWSPNYSSLFSKFMLHKTSSFCTWPKTYAYRQVINQETRVSKAQWERIEPHS